MSIMHSVPFLLLTRPQTLGQHSSILDTWHFLQHLMPKDKKMFGIVTSTALEISIGIYEESLNIVVSY